MLLRRMTSKEEDTKTVPLLERSESDFHPPAQLEHEGLGVNGVPVQSRDFVQFDSDVLQVKLKQRTEKGFRRETIARWVLVFFIGVGTAAVGTVVSVSVTSIFDVKFDRCYDLIKDHDWFRAFFFYVVVNLSLAVIPAVLCAFIEPAAVGSGIPEIKATLNGLSLPRVLRFKTLLIKIVGVIAAVASGLPVGKEGPMIHSGSVLAAGLSQGKSTTMGLDTSWTKFRSFRNDREKRDFISCGAAAGVASAFAAPIGGVLFSLEEGSSFWHQALTWRSFFTAMIATAFLALFFSLSEFQTGSERVQGMFTFGDFNESDQNVTTYELWELIFFIIIGVMGGLIGAIFNGANWELTKWRNKNIKPPLKRLLEVLGVSLLCSLVSFLIPFLYKSNCYDVPDDPPYPSGYIQYTCSDGQFNEMATLFFSPSENVIKQLFHSPHNFAILSLAPFFLLYIVLACITYGIAIPSGLFIPCLTAGAALGRIIGQGLRWMGLVETDAGTYALIGAAAVLGGMARMTISLAVILIEATGDIQYGLPLMLTLMVAKLVGDRFNLGLYDMVIAMKHWPFLEPAPPDMANALKAEDVMNPGCPTIETVCSAGAVFDVLIRDFGVYNAFPVLDAPARKKKKKKKKIEPMAAAIENTSVSPIVGTFASIQVAPMYPYPQVMKDEKDEEPEDSDVDEAADRMAGKFCGLILRKHLCTILKKKAFTKKKPQQGEKPILTWDDFESHYPRYPSMKEIDLSPEERKCWINLYPYMHRTPTTVYTDTPLVQAYTLFRTLGLRHLPVLNTNREVMGMITRKSLTEHHIENIHKQRAGNSHSHRSGH